MPPHDAFGRVHRPEGRAGGDLQLGGLLLEADPRAGPPDAVCVPEAAAAESRTIVKRRLALVPPGIRRRIAFDAWMVGAPDPHRYVSLPVRVEEELLSPWHERGSA